MIVCTKCDSELIVVIEKKLVRNATIARETIRKEEYCLRFQAPFYVAASTTSIVCPKCALFSRHCLPQQNDDSLLSGKLHIPYLPSFAKQVHRKTTGSAKTDEHTRTDSTRDLGDKVSTRSPAQLRKRQQDSD
jgi:hypothetical protein